MKSKFILATAACALMGSTILAAPASAVDVKLEEVASGLTAPLAMASPPGDDRIFIVEQPGIVKILQDGELLDEPFLNVRHRVIDLVPDFDERGLYSIAFHPNFAENGKFYVSFAADLNAAGDLGKKLWWSHSNVVSEFTVSADDPNVADPRTERVISDIAWPQFNHNGHWIGFGADDMLYISVGDGGYANDWGIGHNVTEGNGQDPTDILGNIIRVNVDTEDGSPYSIPDDNPFVDDSQFLPEIFAYGIRNSWRCSFDMGGDNALFCGDVGQNSYEEINIVPAGGNMGWRQMEGTHCFDYVQPNNHPESCDTEDLVMPILDYKNCSAKPDGCEGISVTGGYVYRGGHADWDGSYIFGDWSKSFDTMNGQLFMATDNGDGTWAKETLNVVNMEGNLPYVLSFGQDNAGEVYVGTSITTGPNGGLDSIYKIVPAS